MLAPEADREVTKTPIALAKDKCIPALSLDSQYKSLKIDLRHSSPKRLFKHKLFMLSQEDQPSSNRQKVEDYNKNLLNEPYGLSPFTFVPK